MNTIISMENSHNATAQPSTWVCNDPLLVRDDTHLNLQIMNQSHMISNIVPINRYDTNHESDTQPILTSPDINNPTIPVYQPLDPYLAQNDFNPHYHNQSFHLPHQIPPYQPTSLNSVYKSLDRGPDQTIPSQPIPCPYYPIHNIPSSIVLGPETQSQRPFQSLSWPLPHYPPPDYQQPNLLNLQQPIFNNLPTQNTILNDNIDLSFKSNQTKSSSTLSIQPTSFKSENHDHPLIQTVSSPGISKPNIIPSVSSGTLSSPRMCSAANFINMTVSLDTKTPSIYSEPFKCQQCPLTFNRKNSLKRHEQLHSGNKPYHCSPCNKSFSRMDIFKRHRSSRKCIQLTEKYLEPKQS